MLRYSVNAAECHMFFRTLLASILAIGTTPAVASQFQSGDWSAVAIGNTCFVYTERAAPDTSGTLVFGFGGGGFNATFRYDYQPWPDEQGAPWDADDIVVLEIDGAPLWLSDEMFTGQDGGYMASMTDGFVPDMVLTAMTATDTITFALDRSAFNETWIYGIFSVFGFRESLEQAAHWCDFDPRNLPRS